MAKRKRKKRKWFTFNHGLEQDTLYGIAAVVLFVLGVVFVLAAFSLAGPVGTRVYNGLVYVLGVGYFLLPVLAVIVSIALFRIIHTDMFGAGRFIGAVLFFVSGLGLIGLVAPDYAGLVGTWIATPLVSLFDVYATGVILVAFTLIALLLIFNTTPSAETLLFWRRFTKTKEESSEAFAVPEQVVAEAQTEEENTDDEEEEPYEKEPEDTPQEEQSGILAGAKALFTHYSGERYTPPPLKLLEKDRGKPSAGDIKANANIIQRTLANFNITVAVEEITVGPSVTRYAIKPAEGVRLSKIVGLQNNLELALAAHPVRIEAPIPGRPLVGIEIPNNAKTVVGLGTLLKDDVFAKAQQPLFTAFGRSVSGKSYGADLGKLPHLLIAGATGSGKSVAIHSLITSLLYRNGPEHLRFIMVDPKRVELTLYNGTPHLLTPVITDAKKTILALKWLTQEMERRYDILQEHSVRDIASYHSTVLAPAIKRGSSDEEMPEPLPYIVVVIDELADIMSAYPRELEAAIVRLAQMSRAVGIHLVLSTQRPSVNVITGLIKANVPGRIALQVSSQVDSRTILDMAGAEKLLGAGDMLYLSGDMAKPVRLQGGFITEKEVKRVVRYLKKHYDEENFEELDLSDETQSGGIALEDDEAQEDELYEDAREIVVEAGKASTSYLQRKLRVGYARAARLIDMLEERGVVGPADGSKPRDVLVDTPDDSYDNPD